jgi:thiamine-monophosphate kinase
LSHSTVSSLGEHALIARITARLAMPPWVAVGPGDDAAVIQPVRGALDVLTTDAQVDGIHFDLRFVPPEAAGHRALAVNLSDLAAMGAEPRAALLSLLLPDSLDVEAIDRIMDGLLALASQHRVTLIGGNIARTSGPLALDVTAIGSVRPRRVMTRAGARPGDEVYVTGTLGDAAVGLRALDAAATAMPHKPPNTTSNLEADLPDSHQASARSRSAAGGDAVGLALPDRCVARYLRPEPRVRAGLLLGRNRAATSCIDLSDGLADGIRQVAAASDVGITVDESSIPTSEQSRAWHVRTAGNSIATALTGGDDYELLFTVGKAHRGRFRGVLKQMGDLPITRIGVVTRQREILLRDERGVRELPEGYEHFR